LSGPAAIGLLKKGKHLEFFEQKRPKTTDKEKESNQAKNHRGNHVGCHLSKNPKKSESQNLPKV